MGIWDAFSEIVEAVTPWSVVEAEAPAEDSKVRINSVQLRAGDIRRAQPHCGQQNS